MTPFDTPAASREIPVPDQVTMMMITDINGGIVYINKAMIEIGGYSQEELLGVSHKALLHEDVPDEVLRDVLDTLRSGHSWSGLVKKLCKNGDSYWVQVNATPIIRGGSRTGYMSVQTRPDEAALAQAKQLYHQLKAGSTRIAFRKGVPVRKGWLSWTSLFRWLPLRGRIALACALTGGLATVGVLCVSGMGAGIAVTAVLAGCLLNAWMLEVQVVRPLVRLHRQAQIVASGQSATFAPQTRADEIGMLRRAINQAGLNLSTLLAEIPNPLSDDDLVDRHAGITAVRTDHDATPVAAVPSPISTEIGQLVQSINKIGQSLHMDKLTGTYNRSFLIERFASIQRKARLQPDDMRSLHALLFVDLDNFKFINDQYGHDAGDAVLKASASRLSHVVRSGDVICRYGGDEFVVLLNDIGMEANIHVVVEKIRLALAQPIETGAGVLCVGASIGWAGFRGNEQEFDGLLKQADHRMMEDKRHRKKIEITANAIDISDDTPQLYGPTWVPVLTSFAKALQPYASAVIDRFYEHLTLLPGAQHLVTGLSAEEAADLKQELMDSLLVLVSPELTADAHRDMARKLGHGHAIAGLNREVLVRSHDILLHIMRGYVDAFRHSEAFAVLGRRFIRDLSWQTEEYQRLQVMRNELLLKINEMVWRVDNYTDLITDVAWLLGQHEEFAGCFIGRPDDDGIMRTETVSGGSALHFVRAVSDNPRVTTGNLQGQGVTGRAWRSGEIEHVIDFASDPGMAPWSDLAACHGLRSVVSVPLCVPGQEPKAILELFCEYPGGFSSDEHKGFLMQLQSALVSAISRLETAEKMTSPIPYARRQHMVSLLNSGGLEMHYQPILHLSSGEVRQVEALARLRDGDRLLRPHEFFSALTSEDFLKMYMLGLKQVLTQRQQWADEGIGDIRISMNLPVDALSDERYYVSTQCILREFLCPPDRLTLEVLETDDVPRNVDAAEVLAQFKRLGVGLSEDDLGSGHSSLMRLRELPFDAIKIDRSIVSHSHHDMSNVLRFIYQLTRLGHSLGKRVIVEGVESEDLLEAVTILGSDCVQGYVIARPMSSQQLSEWMHARKTANLASVAQRRSTSLLGRLASLLIWEEHLSMQLFNLRIANDSAHKARISAAFDDMELTFPFEARGSLRHNDLIDVAVVHGTHSDEYRTVREKMLAELGA
jgi:diguanylate cyclase (GGDEF)-like protein/PAS domain S-box-containing protein